MKLSHCIKWQTLKAWLSPQVSKQKKVVPVTITSDLKLRSPNGWTVALSLDDLKLLL